MGVAATTLTITGGSDYTLTNATITNAAISRFDTALGFPNWFNYSPTYTGFSVNPTPVVIRFFCRGNKCTVVCRMGGTGTSSTTGFGISAPIVPANIANAFWGNQCWTNVNNSVQAATPGPIYIGAAATFFALDRDNAGLAWTAAGGKRADFQIEYEF